MSTDADRGRFASPKSGYRYAPGRTAGGHSSDRTAKGLFGRIDARELRRRAWHMAPGLLPFILWPIPHRDPISPILRSVILLLTFALATGIFVEYRLIQRRGEQNQRFWAVIGYAGSVLLTLLLFPGMAEIGMTVLAVLAFGDGSATLGGMLIRGRVLPWNGEKTLSGFCCFLLVGIPMSAMIYWGEANNLEAVARSGAVGFRTALLVGGTATVAAAIAESIPSRINDNIRVGLVAATVAAMVQWLVVGWS